MKQVPKFGGAKGHQPPTDLWDISDEEDGAESDLTSGIINEKHHKLLKVKGLLKIPEPVVYKNDCAVKGLIVQDDVIIIATDQGEVKVIDKFTFKMLGSEKIANGPILKIEQVLYAVLAQVKDVDGTVCTLKIWRTGAGKYQIKKMSEIKTYNQSFTTFGCTVLCQYSRTTGEFVSDHLAIITPCPE